MWVWEGLGGGGGALHGCFECENPCACPPTPPPDLPTGSSAHQVSKPAEVVDAEQVKPAVSDDTIIRVLTAFNVAVGRAAKIMRQLLGPHRCVCGGGEGTGA